jgi:glyoxylase-like metal-dependent hydrolase (beta-lactamase superfamily II)
MIHYIRPVIGVDSNIYLLTGEQNILVDTGTGLTHNELIRSIKDILGSEKKLEKVLLTHCHFDHIGGAPYLISEFGCEVYAGHIDAAAIREGDYSYTLCRDFDIDIPAFPVTDLCEGDVIDNGEHRLRVIDTPGHTPGGVCFFDEISSSLFSGDTVFAYGVGRTDFKGGSLEFLRKSIKKLTYTPVKELYPGHGPSVSDGSHSVQYALDMVGE